MVSEHANPLAAIGGVDAGGQNVHVAALAAALVRRGHGVTVFTRRDRADQSTVVLTDDGYRVHHLSAGPAAEVPKDELLPYVPQLARGLTDALRAEPFDVVHAHFWMSGLVATAAVREVADSGGPEVPVVQTFHALGSVKRRHQRERDTSPPGRVTLERRLCRDVDHVIATCSDEVHELAALGLPRSKASVVPCGVDTTRFRPEGAVAARPAAPRILSIGRLVERKGVEDVIRAMPYVPGAELAIAGGPAREALHVDPEACRLADVAGRLGVADRVTLLGAVAREDVPPLLRSADIVVATPWYEPFGIVPLEAMACGRPVVASAVGGLTDTVSDGETGILVAPRDAAAIGGALQRLLGDPALCVRLGQGGRARVLARYRWDHVAEASEAVYLALTARRLSRTGTTS